MIETTERKVAEMKIEVVKTALKDCDLDYYMCETPFSIAINIRKKMIKDFSPKVTSPTSSAFTPDSISSCDYSLTPSSPNDSGVSSKCPSCEDLEKALGDTRKQIVENELKSNRKIENLQKESESRDSIISKLNSQIKSLEDTCKNLKNEIKVKNEQVKQQKSNAENVREKLEKVDTEKETLKTNLSKKIANLENKNKELASSLKKSISELDNQKLEFRKVDSDLQSIRKKQQTMKQQESQTEIKEFKSVKIQTVKIEANYIDIGVKTENKSLETSMNDTGVGIETKLPFIKESDSPIANSSSETFDKTETFKKSTLPPRIVPCTSCFGNHILIQTLSWPKKQCSNSKYIPISFYQHEWPAKQFVDSYVEDFGDHECEACVQDAAPWKEYTCDNSGVSNKESLVYVCAHNLVEFGSLRWWERTGLPSKK